MRRYTHGMNEFLKMDVFFAVTTVVVIVVGGFSAYALWRLSRVLKNIEHISAQVAAESDSIRHDLAEMRSDLHHNGLISSLAGFLMKRHKRSRGS